ncbi:MAG: hypothetical protein ABIG60_03745 [Patescibacteria group bacterium]
MKNPFAAKDILENKAFPEINNTSSDSKNLQLGAEEIKDNPSHKLNQLMQNPYWVKNVIEEEGEELSKKFNENLRRATKIISEKFGYDEELILKVYNLTEKEKFQVVPPKGKKLH